MIPLRDDNPTAVFPWVTIALIAANVAVFGYEITRTAPELEALVAALGFTAARAWTSGGVVPWPATIFTSMFIHAGWMHLLGNMLYLWIFGNNVEDRLGHLGFLVFYGAGGAVAAAAQFAANQTSTVPMIGASGAVAAVLGAYVVLYPQARVLTLVPVWLVFEVAALPAVFTIGFWFLLQLAQGLGALASSAGIGAGVAWFAHIGGFVAGALAAAPAAIADRKRYPRKRRTR